MKYKINGYYTDKFGKIESYLLEDFQENTKLLSVDAVVDWVNEQGKPINAHKHGTYFRSDPEYPSLKELQKDHLKADSSMTSSKAVHNKMLAESFKCPIRTQLDLEELLYNDEVTKQRFIKKELDEFCAAAPVKKLLGIYGLRRTGKSVLMRSKALELMKQGKKVIYFDFELDRYAKFSDLIADLKLCKEGKVEYVFIDEITFLCKEMTADLTGSKVLMPEFPVRGMEIYAVAMSGKIHVIVSGTDSYCLSLAKENALYDRIIFVHTTHISYKEYTDLLGAVSVGMYIKAGGVLPRKEMEQKDWAEYVDTAIINNVLTSIVSIHPNTSRYNYLLKLKGTEIRSLILYTMAMTVISFIETLYLREYRYPELSSGVQPIVLSGEFLQKIKDRIKKELFLERIDVQVLSYVLAEMEQVLVDLDVITQYTSNIWIKARRGVEKRSEAVYVLAITGLRTYQLMKTLWSVQLEVDSDVSIEDKNLLLQTIKTDMEGRLIEALVLSETVRSFSDVYHISQCRIFGNESDMVIENKQTHEVGLFEIKKSSKVAVGQVKHYVESSFLADFRQYYFHLHVKSYNVIYTGKTCTRKFMQSGTNTEVEVKYISINDYLINMSNWLP